jgi:hypothetical protein
MEVLINSLLEELRNAKHAYKSYREKLESLPKGSLQVKEINGSKYYYLVFREDGRHISKYLGKELTRRDIEKYEHTKRQRQVYRKAMKDLKMQIQFLERALNASSVRDMLQASKKARGK